MRRGSFNGFGADPMEIWSYQIDTIYTTIFLLNPLLICSLR